ncbi:MAG TPA: hypothetical protein DCF33_18335 [Saprospirales bacterium]|nr:hypothetical protein [Saprospirales bacterium]
MTIRTLLFGMFILVCGCELETEVDIDLPPDAGKMPVILCFAGPDQPVLAYVGQSAPLSADSVLGIPTVISFRIMQGNELLGELKPGPEPGVYVSEGPWPFIEGAPYHLEVHTVEFGKTSSRPAYLPDYNGITHAFLQDSTYGEYGYFDVGIQFDDPAHIENFYAAKANYFNHGIALVDSSASYAHLPLFKFDDVLFDGNPHFFSITIPKQLNLDGNQRVTEADIILFNISRGLFRFLSSITQNEGTAQDVLLSTVPVESNIIGGAGVFGLFRSDTVKIGL